MDLNEDIKVIKTLNPDSSSSDCYFKTRLCHNFRTRGVCQYKDTCSFAHGLHELRGKNLPDLAENGTRVCKMYYRTGICSYGAGCSYLHVESNGEVLNGNGDNSVNKPLSAKVKPCFSFRSTGKCSYGAYCIFVHGDGDTRKSESNMESDKGNNKEVPEDSERSNKTNFFSKPMINQRNVSTQKTGSEKLQEMKKIVDIYGDWID